MAGVTSNFISQQTTVNSERPKILIICDYYLPGYESGGSMRTLVNLVERFSGRFEFFILTRDHDGKLNRVPYDSVKINEWNRVGDSEVYYVSKENIRPKLVRQIIDKIRPAAIYVNSFFSPLTIYTLMLRKFARIAKLPVILAPEGEFSDGSLSIKPSKKKLYLRLAKTLDLYRDIIWKVASETECREVELRTGVADQIFIAANMPPNSILKNYDAAVKPKKTKGAVRIVFLSRYMRTKNLNWLLQNLSGFKGSLEIDIYGPIEDADYWLEASKIITSLPENIKVKALGPVPNSEAASTMAAYHFFILPTLGENFGHVFIEALAAGCPLIISDRTPWLDLQEKGIGWDLPLESQSLWIETLKQCVEMTPLEYKMISSRSRQFALDWLSDPSLDKSNLNVIEYALNRSTAK